MRWLTRLCPRRQDRERGAVAVFVALLIPVLIGCAALSVDVGSLTSGRRSLQNAADAVALSAAQTCAKTQTCPAQTEPGLKALADDNDSGSTITKLCGVGNGLPSCDPLQDSLADCPIPAQSPPAGTTFVRAYTTKKQDFVFASVIGGVNSTMETTCASVAWGSPGSISTTIPFTLGMCQWNQDTTNGTSFPGPEIGMQLNDKGQTCPTFNGHDYPGGFGYLTTDSACHVTINTLHWVPGNTGKGKINQNGCDTAVENALGSIVYVPIFDCYSADEQNDPCDYNGQGSGTEFHIAGLAAFFLTGVSVPGLKNTYLPGHPSAGATAMCQAQGGSCVYGYFTKALVPVGSIDDSGNSPNLGLTVLQMTG